jgi:hypothetical protein
MIHDRQGVGPLYSDLFFTIPGVKRASAVRVPTALTKGENLRHIQGGTVGVPYRARYLLAWDVQPFDDRRVMTDRGRVLAVADGTSADSTVAVIGVSLASSRPAVELGEVTETLSGVRRRRDPCGDERSWSIPDVDALEAREVFGIGRHQHEAMDVGDCRNLPST